MAQNRINSFARGDKTLNVPVPSGTDSGEPCAIGAALVGVALTTRDANGFATVQLDGVFDLPVVATTDDSSPTGGSSAVAIGDKLYLNATTQVVSKDSSGTIAFGIALETISAGQQDTIHVLLLN